MWNESYGWAVLISCFIFCFTAHYNTSAEDWIPLSGVQDNGLTSKIGSIDSNCEREPVLYTVGELLPVIEPGGLLFVEPSPDKLKTISCSQAIGGKCWTDPAIANEKFCLRNAQGILLSLDIHSP